MSKTDGYLRSTLTAMLLAACAACTTMADKPAGPAAAPAVAPSGILRATFLGSNPAQARIDAKTGEMSGVVPDLVRELARRMGVPYEIYPAANAADIIQRLDQNKSDIGFFAYDAKRAKDVDFSHAYALMYNAFTVSANSKIVASSEVDRAGTSVAAVRGQTQQIVLSETAKNARVVVLDKKPTQQELEAMLGSGQFDVYAANRQDAEQIAERSGGKLKALSDNFLVVEQSVVTSHGQTEKMAAINRLLDQMLKDGSVEKAVVGMNIKGLAVAEPKKP